MDDPFKALAETSQKDVLTKIQSYNDEMTISQVVRFFERQGIPMTKTMIQNYVRVDVLPPPADKRYYTKRHLLFLYIIDNLKTVFSLDEIKRVFAPVIKDTTTFDDDVMDMFLVYKSYVTFYEETIETFKAELPSLMEQYSDLTGKNFINNDKNENLILFMHQIKLMAQSAASKQMVNLMSENE